MQIYSQTFPHRSSLFIFGGGAGAPKEGTVDEAAGAAGAAEDEATGAEPQSPKSSSGATFGGAGADPKPPPRPPPPVAGGVESPQPPVSLEAKPDEVQSDCCVVVAGLLQSTCGALGVVLLVTEMGELPQPKSAPVEDLMEGLLTERPVCGVATAGPSLLHSFEPHGSEEMLLKDVFVGGADDWMTAL